MSSRCHTCDNYDSSCICIPMSLFPTASFPAISSLPNGTRIMQALNRIAAEPGKLLKLKYLEEALGDDPPDLFFKRTLSLAYGPEYNFGVSHVESPTTSGATEFGNGTVHILEMLANREATGHAARDLIQATLESLDPDSQEVFRRILHKDLRAGFGASTINKVIKGLIRDPSYMRCSLPESSNMDKWDWGMGIYVQLKSDGTFANLDLVDGTVTLTTRSGEIYPIDHPALFQLVENAKLFLPNNTRTHGELVVVKEGEIQSRKVGNGRINSVRQGGSLEIGEIMFHVWDNIPLQNALEGTPVPEPYKSRFGRLQSAFKRKQTHPGTEVFNGHIIFPSAMELIRTDIVTSKADAQKIFREYTSQGLEGAIAKHPDSGWRDGTSKDLVKLKIECTCEMRVFGVVPGKKGTKTEKTFGSLSMQSEDGLVTVDVSGFTDAERKVINADREGWIGAICSVTFNDLIPDEAGAKYHLYLPRFEERRTDKTVADTLPQIQAIFAAAKGMESK